MNARVSLFKSVGTLLERLPERVDVALARTVAVTLGRRKGPARSNLCVNVAHALGGEGIDVAPALLERFVSRGFASYGQYWAEGAKLSGLRPSTITERFKIGEGLEYLLEAKSLGKGIVIALPHIGSWDWGGSFLASIDLGMTAVAEELEPAELFEWFKKKRESIGIKIEPLDAHAGTVLLQTLRDGGVVGLLCYSGPGRDHFAVITAPIAAQRTGRLRDDVTRVTQLIANDLEGLIRRAPEQWHVLQPRFAE